MHRSRIADAAIVHNCPHGGDHVWITAADTQTTCARCGARRG